MFISSYIMLDHWSVIEPRLLYSHTDRYFHFSQTDSQRETDRQREKPVFLLRENKKEIQHQALNFDKKKFIPIIQVTSLKTKSTPTII